MKQVTEHVDDPGRLCGIQHALGGETMRRKQSVLIVTLLILASLAFVSMTRPASEVDSVHPDDTTGEGPPITDTDKESRFVERRTNYPLGVSEILHAIFARDLILKAAGKD